MLHNDTWRTNIHFFNKKYIKLHNIIIFFFIKTLKILKNFFLKSLIFKKKTDLKNIFLLYYYKLFNNNFIKKKISIIENLISQLKIKYYKFPLLLKVLRIFNFKKK